MIILLKHLFVIAVFAFSSMAFTFFDSSQRKVQNDYIASDDSLYKKGNTNNDTIEVQDYSQIINPKWDSDTTGVKKLDCIQLMDRILPQVIRYSQDESDCSIFFNNAMSLYFPENEVTYISEDEDTEPMPHIFSYSDNQDMLFITKAIDKKSTFAIIYTGKNNQVHFFRLYREQWKPIGSRKIGYGITMGSIYLEELNGEPNPEIVISSYPGNMNGNTWKELFVYKENEDKVKFAGTFSTHYTVDLKSKTIKEEYAGSFYMNPHQTLYVWHNDMLVPKKMVIIDVPGDWDTNHKRILKYYSNPSLKYTPDEKGMKLVYKEDFDLSQYDGYPAIWDNFFE